MNIRILWVSIMVVVLQGCQHGIPVSPTAIPTVPHTPPVTVTRTPYTPTNTPAPVATVSHTPSVRQWYLERINAQATWDNAINPVRVAIIDTGIDPSHPDLAARIVDMIDVFADPDMRDRR